MARNSITSVTTKPLGLIALSFVLFLSLLSTTHDNFGMHTVQQAVSAGVNHSSLHSAHGSPESTFEAKKHTSGVNMSSHSLGAGGPCIDICLSAILFSNDHTHLLPPFDGEYLILDDSSFSHEVNDFLRPPQLLI